MFEPHLSTLQQGLAQIYLLIVIYVSLYHNLGLGGVQRKIKNNVKSWYPADDEKAHHKRKRNQPKPFVGRKSIQPGNIVILLSGKHRGRRVVALKTLPSGNLLVTGPYAINGVPLKRVNPAYVIATQTQISVEGVNLNVNDSFFKGPKKFSKL
eukprot:GHVR01032823.1.p1 GENE.GHVR01032823.1~~GHVR01032823.1.p1  ORF type:complete len:153 (+),score=7.91 GHVR01032823.1:588-1046(+)